MLFRSVALPVPQVPESIPWKEVAGGSAALLMLTALVVFLRFLREDRAARDAERAKDREHVEKLVGDCTAMTAKLGSDFSTTQTQLVTSMREDNQVVRREIQDLYRDLKQRSA